jgi:cytochrome c biogenesis protein CcmG/thiol:disulfide interchange protein DsbE
MPELDLSQPGDARFTESEPAGLTMSPERQIPTEHPARASGWLRNVISVVVLGATIAGLVWFLDRTGGPATSQAVGLTAAASGPAPRIGKPAPDFRVVGLDGKLVQLSDFRGHPVWLSFWATWCPPCRAESPDIQAAYQQYSDSGLVILAIDIGEDRATVGNYVARAGLTFSIALDPTEDAAATYRIAGAPTHYFIDADGILRDSQIGNLGKKTMEKKLGKILPAAAAAESTGP